MMISGGGIERVLGPHLQRIYKSNQVGRAQSVEKTDTMSISTEARLVQAARDASRSLPEIRDERVSTLRTAIAAGSYAPSDADVATSIMRGRV